MLKWGKGGGGGLSQSCCVDDLSPVTVSIGNHMISSTNLE